MLAASAQVHSLSHFGARTLSQASLLQQALTGCQFHKKKIGTLWKDFSI